MEAIIFLGDELGSSHSTHMCRICHEEEEEDERGSSMEIPCACGGSLKFAHRECVQRWCDEKGSTACEICLQRYEPGYTVALQRPVVEVGTSIRRNVGYEHSDLEMASQYQANGSSMSSQGTYYCCSIYVILAIILLIRHTAAILSLAGHLHASTLVMVFLLRASGIIFPIVLFMKITVIAIQGLGRKQYSSRTVAAP